MPTKIDQHKLMNKLLSNLTTDNGFLLERCYNKGYIQVRAAYTDWREKKKVECDNQPAAVYEKYVQSIALKHEIDQETLTPEKRQEIVKLYKSQCLLTADEQYYSSEYARVRSQCEHEIFAKLVPHQHDVGGPTREEEKRKNQHDEGGKLVKASNHHLNLRGNREDSSSPVDVSTLLKQK
jgi:hypothetical protein